MWARSGTRDTGRDPIKWAKEMEALGAGEILLTSIDREGTWRGFDLDLVRSVAQAVTFPSLRMAAPQRSTTSQRGSASAAHRRSLSEAWSCFSEGDGRARELSRA